MTQHITHTATIGTVVAIAMTLLLSSLAYATGAPELYVATDQPARSAPADYAPGEVLVKFKNSKVPFEVLPVPNVEAAIAALSKNPNVVYAERNYTVQALVVVNDPLYSYQWHLQNSEYGGIHLEAAWDTSTGAGATVAVVDTGVDGTLMDAPACITAGHDYVSDDTDPTDDNGHGSHVAGTIAQATNNGIGTAGVAYDACIMPVKVLDAAGSGFTDDVAKGIRFAADNGADIINLSLSSGSDTQTMKDAVAYAYSKGVTIVAASGNDGRNKVSYPAAYDAYVIAVGATSYDEDLASYSNYGTALDLVAPGGEMYRYRGRFADVNDENGDGYPDGVVQNTFGENGDGYYFFQGTSMAAPHVAGVAALVVAAGTASTPSDVRAALESTADDLGSNGRDDTFGHGIVNAHQAVLWSNGTEEPENSAPTAVVTTDKTVVLVGESIVLSGADSSDVDSDLLTYTWDFGDGMGATGVTAEHSYDVVGTYTVVLSVSDGLLSDTDTVTVAVAEDSPSTNEAPVAAITYVATDLTILFDGTDSSDIDGTIVSYAWNYGDGNTGSEPTPTHTYDSAGTYTATLTVTDDDGASDTTSTSVTVSAPSTGDITLSATGYKEKGRQKADLTWDGANATNVDIYRDGIVVDITENDGVYMDPINQRGNGTYEYAICDAGTSSCSNVVQVTFN